MAVVCAQAAPARADDPLKKILPKLVPQLSCMAYCSQQFAACMAPAATKFSMCLPFLKSERDFESCAREYEDQRQHCTRTNKPCLGGCGR